MEIKFYISFKWKISYHMFHIYIYFFNDLWTENWSVYYYKTKKTYDVNGISHPFFTNKKKRLMNFVISVDVEGLVALPISSCTKFYFHIGLVRLIKSSLYIKRSIIKKLNIIFTAFSLINYLIERYLQYNIMIYDVYNSRVMINKYKNYFYFT